MDPVGSWAALKSLVLSGLAEFPCGHLHCETMETGKDIGRAHILVNFQLQYWLYCYVLIGSFAFEHRMVC